jgi:hypothetical protein
MNRILTQLAKESSNPNVDTVFLEPSLTPRQMLLFLSSGCEDLINFAFLLQAYNRNGEVFQITEDDKWSIILYMLSEYPELFPVVLEHYGFRQQTDLVSTLETIRIRIVWKGRPKRSQRKRGYNDKGTYAPEQVKYRRQLQSEEAAEEARLQVEHNERLRQEVQFLVGYLS